MLNNYKAIKHELHFGNIYYDDIFIIIYTPEHLNNYKYLQKNAKRGDLLINIDQVQYRNYYIYIIDIVDDNIIIESLDNNNGYEGYPKVPIKFLDILLINNNFWFDILNMNNDYDLDRYSIELYNLQDKDFIKCININNIIHNNIILLLKQKNISFNIYKILYLFLDNPIYYQINNTKCIINTTNIYNLVKYIDYKYNNIIEYKKINDLFYINIT